MKGFKAACLAGTIAFGLIPHVALAQDAPVAAASPAQDEPAQDAGGLTEIVVTAQKRAERLKDVPIAVTAITSEALESSQFTNFNDVQFLAPAVQFTGGSSPNFQVRGVGTNVFDFSIEGSVGVVLDGVPQVLPRSPFLNTLADVDRIEVLRGPQGTLFGKNASAGVIAVTTKPVDLKNFSNDSKLSWGSYNDVLAQNVLNVPFSEVAGARLALTYRHRDGFIRNLFTGRDLFERDDYAATLKIRVTPSDAVDLTLIGDVQRHRDNGHAIWTIRSLGTGIAATTYVPGTFVAQQAALYGITPSAENQQGAWDGPIYNKVDSRALTLNADFDLGPVTLTSVTGWRDMILATAVDSDSTPLPFYSFNTADVDTEQVSQELRIVNNGGAIKYVLGAFASRYLTKASTLQAGTYGLIPASSPFRLGNNFPGSADFDVKVTNYALFSNVTVPLFGGLKLIGGARLTHDDIQNAYSVGVQPNICLRANPGPASAIAGTCLTTPRPGLTELSVKATDWSGKAGLQYDFSNDVMVYGSVARGYKGPGVTVIGTASAPVNPETSTAYEAGIKADLFDKHATLNIAAYRTDYRDFQAQTLIVFNGTNQYAVANAGALRVQGVEVEGVALLAPGLTARANFAYNDSEFLDFVTQCYPGQTQAQGCAPAVAATPTSPAIPASFQAAGRPLNNAPEWTISGGLDYEGNISERLKIDAGVNATYKSEVFFSIGDPNTIQPGYAIVNATLGIGAENGRWRVGVFARNLFDQNYVVQIAPNIGDNRGGSGFVVGYHNRPTENANRTLGVSLDFKFGN